ncbi:SKP1-interacting partner 15 [Cinnamomum micranthum f. kanehirae]|uniref:SKP1-interacting partner 15 n=1 Tax=Cinnamomum micranthum f. kanehirae TaxID=337451 RepID=A0A3S3MQN0_9MAGN|nr:SKP1-interacting partner 15 [Cinnamomum micranthum f. kanehirae]
METNKGSESAPQPADPSPILDLPDDSLHLIFSHLPLRDIILCRSVCRLFLQTLTSPSFLLLLSLRRPPLRLLALRPAHHHSSSSSPSSLLLAFDPDLSQWLRFPLHFLPFRSTSPVASSSGLLYLWADSDHNKTLVVCNPLTRSFRLLPPLGSAWSRHGTVLVSPSGSVLVLTELAALFYSPSSNHWLNFSSNLASKPRSPILVSDTVFALCDVGSPWRSQWKLFLCKLSQFGRSPWERVEKHEWGDVFDILKRPRLIRGRGNSILMAGGFKSSPSLNASCSTILILRLDLDRLEWGEAGMMPLEMFKWFQESSKLKVFGGGDWVCFSAKRVGRLAMWNSAGIGDWRWVDGVDGNGESVCRGFVFDAMLTALP